MNELRIRSYTDVRGGEHAAPTVGELIDDIREKLVAAYNETGELPGIGYIEFLGEDGKLYVVWLDPVVMEVDETAHNPYLKTE